MNGINNLIDNKKDRSEYFREYKKLNHQKIKENNKKYYEDKKNIIHTCDICNCKVKGLFIYRHMKTKKHINNSLNFYLANGDKKIDIHSNQK